MHQLKAFFEQFNSKDRDPCDVAAGMGEARDETALDWIGTDKKYDWNYLRAASVPGVLAPTTITATSRRTKSAASAGNRSL